MKFLDLSLQYENIESEIEGAIYRVIKSGRFILGEEVERLEKEIAEYSGVKFGVGVNSGTDALYLALKVLGIGNGDEVITSDFTYFATVAAIVNAGAVPILVDVDMGDLNINVDLIKNKITDNTKAIIPVHLYGEPCRMREIITVARDHGLKVIEDAAQAIGAEFECKKVGGLGDLGCFSFFPTKNLGAYGDGGMVVTNNGGLAKDLKKWRAHGQEKKYYHDFFAVNSRLDEVQAAVLRVKLKYLDSWNNKVRSLAVCYDDGLTGVNRVKLLNRRGSVFHQYTILAQDRDNLKKYLEQEGIPTMVYYPLPVHRQVAMKDFKFKDGEFSNSIKASENVLSLPIYPELEKNEVKMIVLKIKEFYAL